MLLALWAYHRKVAVERRSENKRTSESAEGSMTWLAGRWHRCSDIVIWWLSVSILLTILILPASESLELDILDVGQGDGAFLRTEEGYTVFVDGGSTNTKQVGTYRILPFLKYKGARQIDFWFVSHTDEDHISGLREILEEGYKVKVLVFAEGIVEDEIYEELRSLAEENGTQIIYVTAGDTLHLGKAMIHVLYPAERDDMTSMMQESITVDKNASSLVFLYEEGAFSAMFTGDIGSEKERDILWTMQDLEAQGKVQSMEIDVYKAAHHGSKYSNSLELLNALRPEIATISCAKKNSYGHPGAEAVAHMEAAGSKVYYTMNSGQITVKIEDGVIKVYEFTGE